MGAMDSIPAIYEDGVFKPVGEVSLPEQTEVRVTVAAERIERDADVIAKQQAAWRELFAQIKADPECREKPDGWSAANNVDDVLYGGPDGPG